MEQSNDHELLTGYLESMLGHNVVDALSDKQKRKALERIRRRDFTDVASKAWRTLRRNEVASPRRG